MPALTFWPVPGYLELNVADKPGEGHGNFGTPRSRGTHGGIDIQAPVGAKVVAAGDGTVVQLVPNPSSTFGLQVGIDHGDDVFTVSAHLSQASVRPGNLVAAGDEIGLVGRSGNTPRRGDPHLHFEVRLGSSLPKSAGGRLGDPFDYLPTPR